MPPNDPQERVEQGRKAANARYAKMSPEERLRVADAARAAQLRKLEDQVDPDRALSEEDRNQRVDHLIKARMADLQLRKLKNQRLAREAADKARRAAQVDALVAAEADA